MSSLVLTGMPLMAVMKDEDRSSDHHRGMWAAGVLLRHSSRRVGHLYVDRPRNGSDPHDSIVLVL